MLKKLLGYIGVRMCRFAGIPVFDRDDQAVLRRAIITDRTALGIYWNTRSNYHDAMWDMQVAQCAAHNAKAHLISTLIGGEFIPLDKPVRDAKAVRIIA